MFDKNAQKITLGISSCLLGQKVRFDGNHKEQRFITQTLSTRFKFVPVCPEIAIGLGVPRTPIHLVGDHREQRVVNVRDESIDHTEQLVSFAKHQAQQLNGISGYIFKKGSPSCGLHNVKIYKTKNHVLYSGIGIFAKHITQANPLLPVEEEGRLQDQNLRSNFLQRVEIYHRWQQLVAAGISKNKIIEFHTRHKFILLAHCEVTYRDLGRLLAQCESGDLQATANQYIALLMAGLQKPTSRGKHTNVLEHLAGYFKRYLDKNDKHEMQQLLEHYRLGALPREVLLALLKHYLRKFPNKYLHKQYYLTHSYSGI